MFGMLSLKVFRVPTTTELTGSGIRIDVATRGVSRKVMTFSSRLARVRITGSSCARLVAGVRHRRCRSCGPCCPVWAEATPTNQIAQSMLWIGHAISLLCASIRRDTVVQSVERMCKPLPTSSQPTRENRLLAGGIGGHDQAKVSMKEC
jgi:hypothetical protein